MSAMNESAGSYDAPMMRPLWHEAAALAARAHAAQRRKDGRTPYFAHPARVAMTIASVFGCTDERVLAAALLHDVIEDTESDYDEIAERFGDEVASWVAAMTKDMRLPEAEREPAYDAQLAAAPWQARLIKLGDAFDNLADAADKSARAKCVDRAHRALALARADESLRAACARLQALVEAVSRGELAK